jgi:transposase
MDSYLKAQFARQATRRGKKRAAIAVTHPILAIADHLLRDGTVFQDLGPAYFDQHKADTVQKQLVKHLEPLGFQVDLQPLALSA